MSYYFKGKKKTDLTTEQKERYAVLRSRDVELPPQLETRLETIREYIGPITSGEVWSAFEELWQDAVVCWILSGENPNIEWVYPEIWRDERTQEEKQQDKAAWEKVLRERNAREECRKRESEQWRHKLEREIHPIRTFFRDLIARFRKS